MGTLTPINLHLKSYLKYTLKSPLEDDEIFVIVTAASDEYGNDREIDLEYLGTNFYDHAYRSQFYFAREPPHKYNIYDIWYRLKTL